MKNSILFGSVGVFLLAAVSLATVALSPQAVVEDTISGQISATRTLTQNARLTGDVSCTVVAAPCLQFGAPGIKLNLGGFTITGLADPSTGCQGGTTANEEGVFANNQADVTIEGPGMVQRFRANGILIANSSRIRVANVTSSTNCRSGVLISNTFDSHIDSVVAVRNGTQGIPCGGV